MRDAWSFAAGAIAIALALTPVERALADAGPFDGMWTVEVDCSSVGDVEGYNWRFPAEVSSGFMSGFYRSATNSAMGHITGRIRPDGGALLSMFGRTGPEQRAVGHERPERRSDTLSTRISTRAADQASETSSAPAR